MRHSHWPIFARNFAEALASEQQWLDPAKVTTLALYCKSGRDRSVGCAAIIACWFRRGCVLNSFVSVCFKQLACLCLCICSTHFSLYLPIHMFFESGPTPTHHTTHVSPLFASEAVRLAGGRAAPLPVGVAPQ